MKHGVLLIQLGSPASPSVKDVKSYLREFLSDPRLIPNQNIAWKFLLNAIILPTRSPKSAEAYASIHTEEGFPLIFETENFTQEVDRVLDGVSVKHSYVIGQGPRVVESMKELLDEGVTHLRVIPQFPQYCEATSFSVHDAVNKAIRELHKTPYHGQVTDLTLEWIDWFHNSPAYYETVAEMIFEGLKENPVEVLLVSNHGLPKIRAFEGDSYFYHCRETFHLVCQTLERLAEEENFQLPQLMAAFQSQFGREEWFKPSTENKVIELAKSGIKSLSVVCPAFTVDNLETKEEIDIELRETFEEYGGEEFHTIPCLNADERWVKRFASEIADPHVEVEHIVPTEAEVHPFPSLGERPAQISPEGKKILKIVFLILFLDLISFSMIFPLFPALLDYYLYQAPESKLLSFMIVYLKEFAALAGGADQVSIVVLFGGFLSFIYSLIQFFVAPILGGLSDKYGRRPILFISVAGLALSYLWWGLAASFGALLGARLLGGLMGSNISTATAVVADITDKKSRSKGMAIVGIAFGLGFIFGPVIGGLSAKINLLDSWPQLANYGVNPFSVPAFIAFFVNMLALHLVYYHFKETLPPEKRGLSTGGRTFNIFKLFRSERYPGVGSVNLANFFFIMAFSGTEFTLTFLAAERLNFTPAQNGLLFLFIGIVLALMQGGYVRRKASIVGEVKMAKQGFLILIPALIAVGFSHATWALYLSTFFMAVGSAQVIPCLTALASKYAPAEEQGRVLGTFRSLGSLGRTMGPLIACVLYWQSNASLPYIVGGLAMLLPFLLLNKLRKMES